MANVLDGSKSQLGKLLASENIRIEHRQVRGPSFDVKNRVLVLPIWQDMSSDLYDLMIGHEVGHALYTPSEGWMDEVKENKDLKSFLNIVEDARIEKLMKRRYPGLRKPMYNGYTELVDRNFFGCTMDEMKYFPFVDRLNVHFKLGPRATVSFTEKEQDLVDRIDACETWDEVMTLAKELYEVSANEKSEMEDLFEDLLSMLDDMENQPGQGMDGEGMDSQESESEASKSLKEMIDRLREAGKDNLADALEKGSQKVKNALRDWMENSDPSSITEEQFKEREQTLIDENAMPITYLNWPAVDSSKWTTPYKIVYGLMNFDDTSEAKRHQLYTDFMSVNKRYINYLVKEFELRRNAKQLSKAKVSKTGKLDVDKVWRYKLSEDLFLQTTSVPKGKNHGMLMIVDLSSSMSDNIAGTIEQMISLSMFCRKVNIPFQVYGFIDNPHSHTELALQGISHENRNDRKEGNLYMNNEHFRLVEFMSHTMKLSEFNNAVQKLLMLADAYNSSYSYHYYSTRSRVPSHMALSSTPLNEAIIVLSDIANKFKKQTGVEVLNTIILTDGDATNGICQIKDGLVMPLEYNTRFVLEYKQEQVAVRSRYNITDSLLDMYRKVTGSRIIGIYLMSGNSYRSQISRRYYENDPQAMESEFEKQFRDQFNRHKFFGLKAKGYDVYYMVPGKELEIKDVTMDDMVKKMKKDTVTKNNLFTAFKKMQNTKMVSRVFLNQFIQHVA